MRHMSNREYFEKQLLGEIRNDTVGMRTTLRWLFEHDREWLLQKWPEIILKYPEHLI